MPAGDELPFNEDVVKCLERLLERAKQGQINFIGYSLAEGALKGDNGYVGELSSFYVGHYGLLHCAKRMMMAMEFTAAVDSTFDAPANEYLYDLSSEPVSHDFIPWLASARMAMAREGVSGILKVCFVRRKTEAQFGFVDDGYREKFYDSVLVPAVKLFGGEVTKVADKGRRLNAYAYGPIVEAVKKGESVPRIQVPPEVLLAMSVHLKGIEPVVITLREHALWKHRNSNMDAWLKFAAYLEDHGERVIFVRDFSKADDDITGFDTMPAASKDFISRAALYECAKCNLFVSNGPATVALFGTRPMLQFINCVEEERYLQNTPRWWKLNHGIEKGEQLPWCLPTQKIVWDEDIYENIVKAWENLDLSEKVNAAA